MDRAVPEEGRKRRLPLWMLGVAAADQVSKSINGDINDVSTKGEVADVIQCHQPKTKGRTARSEKQVRLPSKEAPGREQLSFLVKCETKRKKREVSEEDANCDGNVEEIGIEKGKRGRGGRNDRESAPRKKRKAKSFAFESRDEIEVPSPNEDDGDLTMEDLMSIAKEFVKDDDDDTAKEHSSDRDGKAESQFADISFSRSETGCYSIAPENIRRPPTHEETASCHTSSKVIIDKSSMTGDPTREMLDLFLGPLLKKPYGEEKKVTLVTEDILFSLEEKKQKQNVVIGNELVPLTKKKISLKDKVAMFFD